MYVTPFCLITHTKWLTMKVKHLVLDIYEKGILLMKINNLIPMSYILIILSSSFVTHIYFMPFGQFFFYIYRSFKTSYSTFCLKLS